MNVRLTAMLVVVALTAACSSTPAAFSLVSASVDPTYWCPGGASDAPYTVHATIRARNDTSKAVTVDSATADMVLTGVSGNWLEHVGDRYEANAVEVSPKTIAPSSTATLAVSIPSACTSAMYGSGPSSSGQYRVSVQLVTSAGKFSITAGDEHEIRAA